MHVPNVKKAGKFCFKVMKCVMLGCNPNGYRLRIPSLRRVVRARDGETEFLSIEECTQCRRGYSVIRNGEYATGEYISEYKRRESQKRENPG